MRFSGALCFVCCMLAALPSFASEGAPTAPLQKIDHIVVISLENRSFDHLLGGFPGANGRANAGNTALQVDADNKPYPLLPPILYKKERDPRFTDKMPNAPFSILDYIGINDLADDPVHRFYQMRQQVNDGKMNKFALYSHGLTMGYIDAPDSPLWRYAQKYTLADNFFPAVFGGSFVNHQWLACACVPYWPDAPDALRITLDEKGLLIKDGPVTPDGYVVNTIQPEYPPYSANPKYNALRLPLQTMVTLGDRLREKNISWAWYAGGWNDAVAGKPDPTFQFHHQPYAYYAAYAPDTEARKQHLKDEEDLLHDIVHGTLPSVSFYKPLGKYTFHPGHGPLGQAQDHVFDIVRRIEESSQWDKTLVIVTFDEAGGFWDHVAPPVRDRFGPGVRIPTLFISPHTFKGVIDSTVYDTSSILRLIEERFGLEPLNEHTRSAGDLKNILRQ